MNLTRSSAIRLFKSKLSTRAQRTAFLASFIVIREAKRSRAHRKIELMSWSDDATAWDIAQQLGKIFQDNGDKVSSIERDLNRALLHAEKLPLTLYQEYSQRAVCSFVEALKDYETSNSLLFSAQDEGPKLVGWQPSSVVMRTLQRKVA